VVRTRVGYAGGRLENPSYHRLGDHSETLQVDFDPRRIGYAELLEIFWQEHDPTAKSWSRQYQAAVFYADETQRRLAEESRERQAAKRGRAVQTEIRPLEAFTVAEAYHQKHTLRQHRAFFAALRRAYPADEALMNSTAAARLNGYLGRHGTAAGLAAEIDSLGLPEELRRELAAIVGGRRGS
jgi:methionine-S-sulfoxide reductase